MEATKQFESHGTNAQDEEGNLLRGQSFDSLQVAHILPHALCRGEKDSQLVSLVLEDNLYLGILLINPFRMKPNKPLSISSICLTTEYHASSRGMKLIGPSMP